MFGDAEKTLPLSKALSAQHSPELYRKKKEHPIFTLGEKFWVVKRNRNKSLVCVDIRGVTQFLLRHCSWQEKAFPSGESSESSVQLSLGTLWSCSWLRSQGITLLYVLCTQTWFFTFYVLHPVLFKWLFTPRCSARTNFPIYIPNKKISTAALLQTNISLKRPS